MDSVVTAVRQLFGFVTGTRPQFRSKGGSNAENLALQNIQVRKLSQWKTYFLTFGILGQAQNGSCIHVCSAFTLGQRKKWGIACPWKCQRG